MIPHNATAAPSSTTTSTPANDDGKLSADKAATPTPVLRVVREIEETNLRDARGYKRPIATLPGYHAGRTPVTKGRKYRPTPPDSEEMNALLNAIDTDRPTGLRLHALMVLLWRSGLRISEALALVDSDLNIPAGTIEVLHGKGDKYRRTGMDRWAWNKLQPWFEYRRKLPIGPVFCVIVGPTAGTRAWSDTDVRRAMRKLTATTGARKRLAPHQLRHAHAVNLLKKDVNIYSIQQQLGHARLDVTQGYFSSIAPEEYLAPILDLEAPTVIM